MTTDTIERTDAEYLDAQVKRLTRENELLLRDLEAARIAADNLERGLDDSQEQRRLIQNRVIDLATRVTELHTSIYPTLDEMRRQLVELHAGQDRVANHAQGLVTREELDERDARIVRLCKAEQGDG